MFERSTMRRFLSGVIALTLVGFGLVQEQAQAVPADSNCELSGSGTLTDAYEIGTTTDLEELVDCDGDGIHFTLTQDIDFGNVVRTSPLGQDFEGNLDGRGYTISSLRINADSDNLGMWATVSGNSSIKNLKLHDISVEPGVTSENAGVVFGSSNQGNLSVSNLRIENSSGVIVDRPSNYQGVSSVNSGFLIGKIESGGLHVKNSYFDGSLAGTNVGAVVGYAKSSAIKLENVGAEGGRSGYGGKVGGVLGLVEDTASEPSLLDFQGVSHEGTISANRDVFYLNSDAADLSTKLGGLIGGLNLISDSASTFDSVYLKPTFGKLGTGEVRTATLVGGLASPIIVDDVLFDYVYVLDSVRQDAGDVFCNLFGDENPSETSGKPELLLGEIFWANNGEEDLEFPADTSADCLRSDSFTPVWSEQTNFISPPAEAYAAGSIAIENCPSSDWRPELVCTFTEGADARGFTEFGQGMRITTDEAELAKVETEYDWFKETASRPQILWQVKLGLNYVDQDGDPDNDLKAFEIYLEPGATDSWTPMDPYMLRGDFTLPLEEEVSFSKDGSILRKWQDLEDDTFLTPGAVVDIDSDKRYEAIWADPCAAGTYSADGYADENGNCTEASKGHYVPNSGATAQIACPIGAYQDQTGQIECIQADKGFFVDTTASQAQQRCGLGEFADAKGSVTCQKAEPGKFAEVAGFDSTTDDYSTFFTDDATPGAMEQQVCPEGTYSTGALEQCIETAVGEFANSSAQSSPDLCPAGLYQDETGQTSCKEAQPGFFVKQSGAELPTECPTGTYTTQTAQRDCALGPAGKYLTKQEFTQGSQQEIDFVGVGTGADTARDCPAGTFAVFGDGQCTEAPVGHRVASSGASAPEACEPGTYQDSLGQTECIQAAKGHYVASVAATEQVECEAGTYAPNEGSTYCLQAEPGHKVGNSGASDQEQCEAGSYSTGGTTSCTTADPGYFVDSPGQAYQIVCPAGTYSDQAGATSCATVGEGYFASGTTERAKCETGSYSTAAGVECITASPGFYVSAEGAGNQVACEAGTYSDSDGSTECVSSDPGHFVPKTGMSSQLECAEGYFQEGTKSSACATVPAGYEAVNTTSPEKTTAADDIAVCDTGSYSPGKVSDCIETPAGHFNPAPDLGDPETSADDQLNTNPQQCSLGTYQDQTGQSDCKIAEKGYFVSQPGSTEQTQCGGDSFTDSISSSNCQLPPAGKEANAEKTAAIDCEAGTFSVGNGSGCIDASPGHFVSDPGSSIQVPCSIGTYQPDSKAITCIDAPAGHAIGESGATTLESRFECPAGQFSSNPASSSCTQAMPGHFVSTSGASEQTQCPAGTYSASFAATGCVTAPAGKYVITGLQFAALDCPAGTDSDAGATSCTVEDPMEPTTPPTNDDSNDDSTDESTGGGGAPAGGGGGGGAVGSAPAVETNPVVAGTNSEAETLATSEGEWQGDSLEFSYQWYRCDEKLESPSQLQVLIDCDLIQGATNETYQVTSADEDKHLLASITASAGFYSTPAYSNTIAPGETLEGEVSAETDEPASDAATSTGYWTKRNGDNVKMYAKNIIGLGKVQFFVNGEEIAWIRAEDRTDPKLRVITEGHMKGASYLVRDKDLLPGKNVFEIYLDGERVDRRIASLN